MTTGVRDTVQHVILIHGRISSLSVTLQESLAVAASLAGPGGSKMDALEFRDLVQMLEQANVPGREMFTGTKAKNKAPKPPPMPDLWWFFEAWDEIGGNYGHQIDLDRSDAERSVLTFMNKGLSEFDLEELIAVAMRRPDCTDRWRYFCGCAWRRIKDEQWERRT